MTVHAFGIEPQSTCMYAFIPQIFQVQNPTSSLQGGGLPFSGGSNPLTIIKTSSDPHSKNQLNLFRCLATIHQ